MGGALLPLLIRHQVGFQLRASGYHGLRALSTSMQLQYERSKQRDSVDRRPHPKRAREGE